MDPTLVLDDVQMSSGGSDADDGKDAVVVRTECVAAHIVLATRRMCARFLQLVNSTTVPFTDATRRAFACRLDRLILLATFVHCIRV
jgi:hypothetical protein